jgi:hypothetical protein
MAGVGEVTDLQYAILRTISSFLAMAEAETLDCIQFNIVQVSSSLMHKAKAH